MEDDAPPAPDEGAPVVHILIVDDDALVVEALTTFFEGLSWEVVSAPTGAEALEQMRRRPELDLVLLDINLPDLSGFEVLERAERLGIVAPVVVISTSGRDADRLRALGLGVEDYLTKPFEPAALRDRIEDILGLAHPAGSPVAGTITMGNAQVDLDGARVLRGARTLALTGDQVRLLRVLIASRGQVVSRKRLLCDGLGVDIDTVSFTMTLRVFYEMLNAQMALLQELIEDDPGAPEYLQRVYAQGYRLQYEA